MTSELIKSKIANGEYTVAPTHKGKSVIWTLLCEIIKEDETILEGWIFCKSCKKVLKFIGNQTSNLSRHKCCLSLRHPSEAKKVSRLDKEAALEKCSEWVVQDCRPYSAVSGTGFRNLVKFFLQIGAAYGANVDIDDLLPDANTLSRNAKEDAEEKRTVISKEIKEAVDNGGVSATINMWTDQYMNRNFLGVTLHYLKGYKINDIILGLKSMDFEKSTSENILNKLKTMFSQFDVEDIANIKFVTGRGSNIKKALSKNVLLNCSSHLFSDVLEKSFEQSYELQAILHSCKKIVKYLKQANSHHRLNTRSENSWPPRWNSNYIMISSLVDNWTTVNQILGDTEGSQYLISVNISTLRIILILLEDFERIFKELQTCSSPSLCFVLPSITKIKTLCEPNAQDISPISVLKEKILINVNLIWEQNLSIWHKAAFFLYPPAAIMSHEDIMQIKHFCYEKMNILLYNSSEFPCNNSFTSNESDPLSPICQLGTNSKNQTIVPKTQFFFSYLVDSSTNSSKSPWEEIESYSVERVALSEEFDPIEWWKSKENTYPLLSKLALQLLTIPSSSAAAERVFSLAGNVMMEKRNRLGPKTVDNLLFLHSYYNKFQ